MARRLSARREASAGTGGAAASQPRPHATKHGGQRERTTKERGERDHYTRRDRFVLRLFSFFSFFLPLPLSRPPSLCTKRTSRRAASRAACCCAAWLGGSKSLSLSLDMDHVPSPPSTSTSGFHSSSYRGTAGGRVRLLLCGCTCPAIEIRPRTRGARTEAAEEARLALFRRGGMVGLLAKRRSVDQANESAPVTTRAVCAGCADPPQPAIDDAALD